MSHPSPTVHGVGERWNPWRALRARGHLEFALVSLPDATGGGYYEPQSEGWAAVLIDDRLTRVDRRAVLAHELVHDERGGGCTAQGMPASWDAVVSRDEEAVDSEVARRLVPADELRAFAEQNEPDGVAVWQVAAEFDVPDHVAERACRLLAAPDGWGKV